MKDWFTLLISFFTHIKLKLNYSQVSNANVINKISMIDN